jgi:hypothetical protein
LDSKQQEGFLLIMESWREFFCRLTAIKEVRKKKGIVIFSTALPPTNGKCEMENVKLITCKHASKQSCF